MAKFSRATGKPATNLSVLSTGSAMGAIMLAMLVPTAAQAQDECGAAPGTAGTVTCTTAGNPYNDGITYIAPPADLTIVLEDGVRVDTSGTLNIGILAVGDSALTVDGGTNTIITTDSDGGFGALVSNNVDPLSVTLDQIVTTGSFAIGVVASSSEGDVTVKTNSISTAGDDADGISASTDIGAITIDSGTITTKGEGATAIDANSDFGDLDITSGTIITSGGGTGVFDPGSIGILAQTGGTGTITIDSTAITTKGDEAIGIRAVGGTGAVSVTSGTVATSGLNSDAISVTSAGTVTVDSGAITTTGDNADGIVATGVTGADVTFTSISTTGDNANGVLIPAGVMFFGPQPSATATVNGGSVSTEGDNSDGVRAIAGSGAATVNVTGDISTLGTNSRGIFATGPGGVTVTNGGTISTAGDTSNAVDVSSTAGPIDLTLGDVTTSGELSGGVRAIGGTDAVVTITTGNVTTTGTSGSNYSFLPNSTAIVAQAAGTGSVTVTTGDISTAGLGASGVNAGAAAGDVAVSTGAVSTTGARAVGISANSYTGDVSVTTSGAVATTGDQASGIYASAAQGGLTVDAQAVSTKGFAANAIDVSGGVGGADVSFTDVAAAGTFASGVSASATGGDVIVSGANATASGDAGTAIYAVSDTGDVSVTTTGSVTATGRGGSGIYVTSGTGDASVTVNNVSTVAANLADTDTSRAAIYASGANATVVVTGTAQTQGVALYGGTATAVTAIATAGDASATVNNASAGGAGIDAIVVTATGDASATLTGQIKSTGAGADAVVVTGDTTMVSVGANADVTAADGNSILLTSVTGSTLNNAGTIVDNSAGFAVAVVGGPLTVNNTGNLTSDIQFTGGADLVNNGGIFNVGPNPDFGAGADVFNNTGTGTVRVGNGGTTPVASTFTGLETFNNSGLIELRGGAVGDTLTLPGAFTGTGVSRLGLDVNLGATPTADRLIIGGAATGSTDVLLNVTGQATLNSGVVLVQGGAGTQAGAFALADGTGNVGLIQLGLVFSPTANTFTLVGAPGDAVFRSASFVEGTRNLWYKSADAWSGHMRELRDGTWANGAGEAGGRLWGQAYGSRDQYDNVSTASNFGLTRTLDLGYDQSYFGGQLGFDFGGAAGQDGNFAFGVTGGYLRSDMDFDQSFDRVEFNAFNAGVYAAFNSGRLFANALAKYDHYKIDSNSVSGQYSADFNGDAYGAQGELGFRFGSDSFYVEPVGTISYVRNNLDDLVAQNSTVAFRDDDGVRGKLGARIGASLTGSPIKTVLYAGGNYVHEFAGNDSIDFTNGGQTVSIANRATGDYGEAVIGANFGSVGGVSGFLEANGAKGSDYKAFGGRAGMRIRF